MDLQGVGGSCGDWMELAQDRDRWRALVSTVRNLRVPKMQGTSWLAAEPVSFSRGNLLHAISKYYLNHNAKNTPYATRQLTRVSHYKLLTFSQFDLRIPLGQGIWQSRPLRSRTLGHQIFGIYLYGYGITHVIEHALFSAREMQFP